MSERDNGCVSVCLQVFTLGLPSWELSANPSSIVELNSTLHMKNANNPFGVSEEK